MKSDALPLTTLEQFLLWEDRPAYPWSVFLRLRFRGTLDRKLFAAAVHGSLERHPLLASRVEFRDKRPCWVADPAGIPAVQWIGCAAEPQSETWLDLCNERGSRFTVRTDGTDCSELMIQFHHACCDGIGFFQFLADLLTAYHHLSAGVENPWPAAVSTKRLGLRGRFGLSWSELIRLAPGQAMGLLGAMEFLTRRPVPILPHDKVSDDDGVANAYPALLAHQFSVDETARLKAKAQRAQVTLNDIMTRDLFLALSEFRAKYVDASDRQWIRLMIPMDVRTSRHNEIPAANVVSSVFLDRRGVDAADAGQLLRGIRRQMLRIKQNRLALTFLISLNVCRWLPGGLRRQARKDSCSVSSIFSNIGRVLEGLPVPYESGHVVVNGARLQSIEVAVPNRPYNGASFAVLTYAQRLAVSLHFDPRVLTQSQGAELMQMFVQSINSTE